MPVLRDSETIDVRAPAESAFDVIAGDILAAVDHPSSRRARRPLDEGPLRNGFRWEQTIVHDRNLCRSEWVVTELRRGHVLEQTMRHSCAVSGRETDGGERWTLAQGRDGTTLVTLTTWRSVRGAGGWLRRLLSPSLGPALKHSLRQRVANVQFEAERRAAARR